MLAFSLLSILLTLFAPARSIFGGGPTVTGVRAAEVRVVPQNKAYPCHPIMCIP
jgi:hypothetical protein